MHTSRVDLNLLAPLSILLEERHISRAAARFHLSQSAMSRTLERLRSEFHDELLVRSSGGYELTPRARSIQRELEYLLPRLNALANGASFDPRTATDRARINCTDYASTVIGPTLFQKLFQEGPHVSVSVEPLSARTFDDLEHGRVDLAFTPVKTPRSLRWQPLFTDDFVCVLSSDHPLGDEHLTLDQICAYPQVSVAVLPPELMIVDRRMNDHGIVLDRGLRVPYFTAAVAAIPGTKLIAILPRRFAARYRDDTSIRIAAAPEEFGPFEYGMAWHRRLDNDQFHSWLRAIVSSTASQSSV